MTSSRSATASSEGTPRGGGGGWFTQAPAKVDSLCTAVSRRTPRYGQRSAGSTDPVNAAAAAPRATASATDAALVDAVRAGKESAFEELFRRYHARVYAFVRRRVRDDGRAEDLTQDAFLNALRRLRAT